MNYAGFTIAGPRAGCSGIEHRGPRRSARRPARRPASTDGRCVETLDAFRAAMPWAVARCQYNLLGSHDTARVRTSVGGDPGRVAGRVRAAARLRRGAIGPVRRRGRASRATDGNASTPTDDAVGPGGLGPRPARVRPRTLVRFRVRSRGARRPAASRSSRPATTSLAFLRDTDDEQVIVVVVRGPGSRPGDLPVAIGAIADGTVFTSLLTGERATVAGGRLPLPPTPPGAAFWRSGE